MQVQISSWNDPHYNLGHVRYPAVEALPAMLTAKVPVNGICLTTLLTHASLHVVVHDPRSGKERKSVDKPPASKTSTKIAVVHREKGGTNTGAPRKKIGENSGEAFDAPLLAEFGADRPVLSPITPWAWVAAARCRGGAVCAREAGGRPRGILKQAQGRFHLDIITTEQL